MRIRILTFAALLILALTPAGADEKAPLRVLFIGNSFTHMNDLPRQVVRLAATARPPRAMEVLEIAEGGATLKRHWEAGPALDAIRNGKWDYVVLQEQGTLGPTDDFKDIARINDPAMFHQYARLFDGEIRKSGARTILFLTWARQDAPQSQAMLTNAYIRIGEELKALVVPVGIAWQHALKENPKLVLHHADRSHPGPAGSYLAACLFYSLLFSSSPEGLSAGDISEDDAAFLQRIAWQTAKNPQLALAAGNTQNRPSEAAAAAATPEAVERGLAILAAAQKAAGGLERLRALEDVSVTFSAKVLVPGGEGMTLRSTETFIFPDVLRIELQMPLGDLLMVYDGTTAWRKTRGGVQDLPERAKQVLRGQAIRNYFNLLRAEGEFTVQFERREKVGLTDADVITMIKEGERVRMFVDPVSGMLLKRSFQGMGTGGLADIEEIYSDFREVAGLQIPFKVATTQNGSPYLEGTISEVKFNNGLDRAEVARRPVGN